MPIKILLVMLSFCGYFLVIKHRGIELAFAPALTVSGVGICMFFAGLLNIMPHMALLFFLMGLFCFAKEVLVERKRLSLPHVACLVFFLAGCLFLRASLYNVRPVGSDNYSHWLVVVRDMLNSNQLPNFQSSQIIFQSYPTGTAGFIYYICRVVGNSEDVVLFAQGIIIISALCVFWAFVKRVDLFSVCFICILAVYMLIANTLLYNLYVDSVLAVIGCAGFAVLYYYRCDLKKAAICLGLISGYVVLVKNSGVFFAGIHGFLICLLLAQQCIRDKKWPSLRQLEYTVGAAVLPVFIMYLWKRHVYYSFYSGTMSRHSMSVENYTTIIGAKSADDIKEIVGIFIRRLQNPQQELFVLLPVALMFILAYFLCKRFKCGKARDALLLLGWCAVTYCVYMIGLGAMYLLSMTYAEATRLASFTRYVSTDTMYILSIFAMYLLEMHSEVQPQKNAAFCVALLALVIMFIPVRDRLSTLVKAPDDYQTQSRALIERICEENDLPEDDDRYFLLSSSNGNGFLLYLTRYILWSDNVKWNERPDPADYPDFMNQFDYVLVPYEEEYANSFLRSVGLPLGEQCYRLEDYR